MNDNRLGCRPITTVVRPILEARAAIPVAIWREGHPRQVARIKGAVAASLRDLVSERIALCVTHEPAEIVATRVILIDPMGLVCSHWCLIVGAGPVHAT